MAVLKLTQPSEARLLPPRPVREPPERKQGARSACNPAPALARPRRAPRRVRGQPQDGWAHIAGHTAGICGRRLAQRERPEREWEAYATRLDAAGAMGQLQAPPVVHDGLLSAQVAYSRAHSVAAQGYRAVAQITPSRLHASHTIASTLAAQVACGTRLPLYTGSGEAALYCEQEWHTGSGSEAALRGIDRLQHIGGFAQERAAGILRAAACQSRREAQDSSKTATGRHSGDEAQGEP